MPLSTNTQFALYQVGLGVASANCNTWDVTLWLHKTSPMGSADMVDRLNSPEAVSYTHLDVYKRQDSYASDVL